MRFRLDKWWFGLPLLLRGPLMSLVVTCATDFVDVQVCLIVLVLTGYALIQATARPWKAPILNWMDLFVSILLIQIAALSGLKNLKVSSFSEFYSHSLLVLLVCTVCTMWFFLAIALVLELFYGLKAKDSAILRVFESRGQDLGEMLVAIARALQQEEVSQATLQRVFDRMNNHDLSRLETSLELLLTGFMGLNTGLQVPSRELFAEPLFWLQTPLEQLYRKIRNQKLTRWTSCWSLNLIFQYQMSTSRSRALNGSDERRRHRECLSPKATALWRAKDRVFKRKDQVKR